MTNSNPMSNEPRNIIEGGSPQSASGQYEDRNQWLQDMGSRRYKDDSAFQDIVIRKAQASGYI